MHANIGVQAVKTRAIIAIVVLAIVFGGGWWIDHSRALNESTLSGFFESEPTLASSRIGGRVQQIFVKEGDMVKRGERLALMEDRSYAADVGALEQGEQQAKQAYKETLAGPRPEDIQKQRSAYQAAAANYEKVLNGPRPEEIASSRAKLQEAQANYQKMLAGPRPQEIASAKAAAQSALERWREAQRGLTAEERAELKARGDEANAALVLAQKDLARYQVLFRQGAIARQQLDQETSDYQQAQGRANDAAEAYKRAQEGTPPQELAEAHENYLQAKAQLDLVTAGNRKEDIVAAREQMLGADQDLKLLLAGSRPEDIATAKAQMEQERAALAELENGSRKEDVAKALAAQRQAALQTTSSAENLRERTVYAPIDGKVDRVLVADGDLLAANAPLIQLSDPSDIWIRFYLPEEALAKVKTGDSAVLSVDGVSGDVSGVVESIDQNGQFTPANLQSPEERAMQVYGIRVRLAHPDSRVKAGMYVTARSIGGWR